MADRKNRHTERLTLVEFFFRVFTDENRPVSLLFNLKITRNSVSGDGTLTRSVYHHPLPTPVVCLVQIEYIIH